MESNDKMNWINPKIKIADSPIHGKGFFAVADIEKGEKIVIWKSGYTDRSGAEEAVKNGRAFMQWDEDVYSVDDGNDDESYSINHSCDPNAWMSDAFTLIAARSIKAGNEITADYALWEADEEYVCPYNCNCRSALCRGRITGKDWRKPELQERYKGHFSPLINKRIAKKDHLL